MTEQPPLYVKVWTLHGQQLMHCDLAEFQRLQSGLLRRNSVLRVEIASKPVSSPLIPSDSPFRYPPVILFASESDNGGAKVSAEITVIIRGGPPARVLVEFSTKSTEGTMRALRSELHKRLSLSSEALKNFKDWWDHTAEEIFLASVQEVLESGVEE